jgi:hypothetical protein
MMQLATAEADAGAAQQALRETGNQPVDEPKLATSQHDELSHLQAVNQTLVAELEELKAALIRQQSDMQPSKGTVRLSEEANRSRPELLKTGMHMKSAQMCSIVLNACYTDLHLIEGCALILASLCD